MDKEERRIRNKLRREGYSVRYNRSTHLYYIVNNYFNRIEAENFLWSDVVKYANS